jgi:glyoxylase-like metal-dependent hydrolase (beta-lactamase superfamily II)
MRFVLSIFLMLSSLPLAQGETRYPPVSVPLSLIQVTEHVYYAQGAAGVATDNEGYISNAGVIVTDAGVVVFDALGTPSLAQRLLEEIGKITSQPVVKVVVSHYHADHIYGLQVFAEAGAEILAPLGVERYLRSDNARSRLEERRISLYPWVDESTRLVEPDRYVGAPERFELGGIEFLLTPVGSAHSDSDMTLYVVNDRVLFSGDVIFEGRVPFLGDANTGHWLKVLEELEERRLRALIPGHGGMAEHPNQAIALTRRYLAYLREQMGAAVADFVPFDEAYRSTDWSEFEDLPAFDAANRRNAYQVYLSMEAEAFSP